jgi:hypothetical protein
MLRNSVAAIGDLLADLPPSVGSVYKDMIEPARRMGVYSLRNALSAEQVALVIYRALTARWFRARYLLGGDAKLLAKLEVLPTFIRDFIVSRAIGLA